MVGGLIDCLIDFWYHLEHPSVKKGCPPVQEIADGNDLVYQKPGKKKSKKKKHLETDQVDGSTIPPPIATPQTQETVNTTEVGI